jgi:hypothetical protein
MAGATAVWDDRTIPTPMFPVVASHAPLEKKMPDVVRIIRPSGLHFRKIFVLKAAKTAWIESAMIPFFRR